MKQLTQILKTGKMQILEVPYPNIGNGYILIRNHYSVISSGTEGKTVKDARASYIGKAKSRPKEVKQVLTSVKSQGLVSTYKLVMNKLDAPSPLGYSCAGEVIDVGAGITEFTVGDLVAGGGVSASHAEVVSVPKNLCAKIPSGVDVKCAAFSTIAAIAVQGVRQADLRFGENCVVIGLGLLGQITIQLLNAAGIQSIGIDIDPRQVKLAEKSNPSLLLERDKPDLEELILDHTNGFGTDAVIITAGTSSLDPIELAGLLCRKKGKVVIVGAVPTGFNRANYYKKELDLRMSCSYGPGRYDLQYEEKGVDYPIGYVRWTEQRNMITYLQFLKDKKLNPDAFITHTFDFENASEAYNLILNKSESFAGILLKYDVEKELKSIYSSSERKYSADDVNIGFIGTGSFAQNFLLPAVQKAEVGNFVGIAEAQPTVARNVANKYKFNLCKGKAEEIINDTDINTVFIATRHNLHAQQVLQALKKNKNIFVEKPLCMTEEELEEIKNEYNDRVVHLMVGYNRRFAPLIGTIRERITGESPKAINYRINAGIMPSDHWVHDKDIGGGRILGEACHFIDLVSFLAGDRIKSVSAKVMDNPNNLHDTLVINLSFRNGSVASISYFSNGNKKVNKEYLEVFSGGQVAILDDFKKVTIYDNQGIKTFKSKSDKGHESEVAEFLNAVKNADQTPINFQEIYSSQVATFKVIESIRTGVTIHL